MSGVLDGLKVLDLSWGVAGPMTTMLLADHGADVTKIEPPGGDPFRMQLGYKVWGRGKRSAILDLKNAEDLQTFLALTRDADILVESFSPGVTKRLGIDYDTLGALNPRLIYCSITAYGRDNEHSDRPGYDALVAVRLGLQWEQRGWPEGAVNHMSGRPDPFPDIEVPWDYMQGAPRPGPLFTASHWPSLGAFFGASVGINGALRAREITGRGQWVETSLLQGAMTGAIGAWQRAENPDHEGFDTWILGSKSPKGHFQCSDGRWMHHWVTNPRFILTCSEGDTINSSPDLTVQNDPDRFGTGPEELIVLLHYQPILAERMKKFPADDWIKAASIAKMTMQEVRSPERALSDPLLLADGCVAEVNDPELGKVRQVGIAYQLTKSRGKIRSAAAKPGAHTETVKAEAKAAGTAQQKKAETGKKLSAPLAGITVLDLGLAIAGPYGCQVLSDMGANVIKINALYDNYWHRNHIAAVANRGKRSLQMNLKDPRAMKILHELVAKADVVHTNMRYDAAERLGVDFESLKKINPKLVYAHTRGHEKGPREGLPGNDQTAGCLAGVQYEDGGMARGGKPMWSFTSFGDTGCGYLSAIGVIQALYHRDKTGEGQMVDTSIINAHLLNTSYAMAYADGRGVGRPKLDAMQTGLHALYRLYECSEGWLCIAAPEERHWQKLCTALKLGELVRDERFATAETRLKNDAELVQKTKNTEEWLAVPNDSDWNKLCAAMKLEDWRQDARFATAEVRLKYEADLGNRLELLFKQDTAEAWFSLLDAAGVPCEISAAGFCMGMYDDPEMTKREWVASYEHPFFGRLDQIGVVVNLSDTPSHVQGPPFVCGQHTSEILKSLGYSDADIETLRKAEVISTWQPGTQEHLVASKWTQLPTAVEKKNKASA